MIIDYDFRGRCVTLVGGGHETARKMQSFVDAGAKVRLVGPTFDAEALRVARRLRVRIVDCSASQALRQAFADADVVAVVSDDPALGRKLRPIATKRRVLFYAGDDPEVSDWIQPAVRFADPVVLAVSTGGASPIVARELAERLIRRVRPEDRLSVEVQAYARELARERIPKASDRRFKLNQIYRDLDVRSALAARDLMTAKHLARAVILDASGRPHVGPRLARRR